MAYPMAKTIAIKDACDHFGNLFGANLNRKDTLNYSIDETLKSRDWKAELEAENSITGLNEIWRQMSENEQVRYKLLYTEKLNECGLS
jgi:hypothetical protein